MYASPEGCLCEPKLEATKKNATMFTTQCNIEESILSKLCTRIADPTLANMPKTPGLWGPSLGILLSRLLSINSASLFFP